MAHKYNKRYGQLARSVEHRLKKLPRIIRQGLRSGADRQLAALKRVERSIEIIAQEIARQREALENDSTETTKKTQ